MATYTTTYGTFRLWGINTITGNFWIGATMTGRTSGATGILVGAAFNLAGAITTCEFFQTSVGGFSGLEIVDLSAGGASVGTFTLTAAESSNQVVNVVWYTGEEITDSTSNVVTHALGATAVVTDSTGETAEAVDISETEITTDDGTLFTAGKIVRIDTEDMRITSIKGNTITVIRAYMNSTAATHTTATTINHVIVGCVDTTANTNEAVNATEPAIDVTDGTQFVVGDIIVMDAEEMRVTAIATNTLTCYRGYNYTTKATHSNGIDIYRNSVKVDDADDFELFDIIKIDDEYMYIYQIPDSTNNVLQVKRCWFGSTMATHTTATDIYIVDDDFFYNIYTNAAAGASMTSNRPYFDGIIIVGDSEEGSDPTIAHSKLENFKCKGAMIVTGSAAYPSYVQIGKGELGLEYTSCEGSHVLFEYEFLYYGGVAGTVYGNLHAYASNFHCTNTYDSTILQRCNFPTYLQSTGVYNRIVLNSFGFEWNGQNIIYWRDLICPLNNWNPASNNQEFERIINGNTDYAFYFIASGGASPTIVGASLTDITSEHSFAFIDTGWGTKTFRNCLVNLLGMSGFWSEVYYQSEYSLDIKIQTKDGTVLEGIRIRAWDDTQVYTDTPKVDETTDANGQIITQWMRTHWKKVGGGGGNFTYNPFTIWITGEGWESQKKVVSFEPTLVGYDWVIELEERDLKEETI